MSGSGLFWKDCYGGEVSADLTKQEKELRDLFVAEYLLDHDSFAAAIRVGFQEQYARQYSMQFMGESYVRRRIAELMHAAPHDKKEYEEETKRKIIASMFREANYRGPDSTHGARVAALAKLASLFDMDKPAKIEQTITHQGGVMAVPGIASIDDWEKQALESQEKLTSEAEA